MSKTLEMVLGVDNLIGQIQTVVNGVPENVFPAGFFTVTQRFSGNQGRYTKVAGTQETATVVGYGSPARVRNKWGLGSVPVTLLHSFESLSIDPLDLANLLAEDNPVRQAMGRQTVARNLANFGQLFRNLRVSAVHSMLSTGAIYFDGAGNLLPNSAGSFFGVDYGVAAGHKDQLGGIIAADWDESGTDILAHVEALQAAALQATGLPLTTAIYGSSLPSYLMTNSVVKALVAGSPSLSEQYARGATIPQGLLGFNWVPGSKAFYRDATGAVNSWVPYDSVVFTPDPSPAWCGMLEGGYVVPSSIEIASDGASALSNFREVQGAFSYATVAVNPPGISHYAGDTFLPVLTNPDAIWIADVKAT